MRIAPLAFIMSAGSADERRLLHDVSRITRPNDEAYTAALAVVRAGTWVGPAPAASLLSSLAGALPDTRVRDAILAFHSRGPRFPMQAGANTPRAATAAPRLPANCRPE
jgi:hypothetical protein